MHKKILLPPPQQSSFETLAGVYKATDQLRAAILKHDPKSDLDRDKNLSLEETGTFIRKTFDPNKDGVVSSQEAVGAAKTASGVISELEPEFFTRTATTTEVKLLNVTAVGALHTDPAKGALALLGLKIPDDSVNAFVNELAKGHTHPDNAKHDAGANGATIPPAQAITRPFA